MQLYLYQIFTLKGNFKVAFEVSGDAEFQKRFEEWDGNKPLFFNVKTDNPNSIYKQ